MVQQIFRCNPIECGCGTACCRNGMSYPSVSLGDYYRLSSQRQLDVTDVADFWLKYGNVSLDQEDQKQSGIYTISFSLLHDPCVFLTHGGRCDAHTHRPIVCSLFPYTLCIPGQAHHKLPYLKEYPCLNNAYIDTDTLGIIGKIAKLFTVELKIQKNSIIDLPHYDLKKTRDDLCKDLQRAFYFQGEWKFSDDQRQQQLVEAVKIYNQLEQDACKGNAFDRNQLIKLYRILLYTEYRDIIHDCLISNGDKIQQDFHKTSQEYFTLLEELHISTSPGIDEFAPAVQKKLCRRQ
jgi:Fe-S-cluster containining protein